MNFVKRIDPATGEVQNLRRTRGVKERRSRSRKPIDHLRYDWLPLRVASRSEDVTQILLEDRGFVTFCPRESHWRHSNHVSRVRRTKRLVEKPWHPGLVFVGMTRPWKIWDVLQVRTVQAIVRDVYGIRRMNPDHIYNLMKVYGDDQFRAPDHQRYMETGAEFEVGDDCIVVDCPLEGQVVRVQKIAGNMARAFTQFFGATRGFDIEVANLRKID